MWGGRRHDVCGTCLQNFSCKAWYIYIYIAQNIPPPPVGMLGTEKLFECLTNRCLSHIECICSIFAVKLFKYDNKSAVIVENFLFYLLNVQFFLAKEQICPIGSVTGKQINQLVQIRYRAEVTRIFILDLFLSFLIYYLLRKVHTYGLTYYKFLPF